MSRTHRDHPNILPKHGPRFWRKCLKSRCWMCRYRSPKGFRQNDLHKAIDFEILASDEMWRRNEEN